MHIRVQYKNATGEKMFCLTQTVVKHVKPITQADVMDTTQSLQHAIYNKCRVLKVLQLIHMWIIQILY